MYKPSDCSRSSYDTLNHEMQAVGFGVMNGVEYITVRNQWGTGWGDNGYVYVYFNRSGAVGTCGIYADNYVATVGM